MARILIVDDDPGVRDYLVDLLQRSGHTVVSEVDGVFARERLKQERFDLLVTDIVMPNKEGLELIIETKLDYPELPIIAISGGIRPQDGPAIRGEFYLELAKELGAERVLPKPFHPLQLLNLVQKELSRNME